MFNSGSYRIMGMLAMSRAIGDHFLRPYVIAEPEVRRGVEGSPADWDGWARPLKHLTGLAGARD